MGESMAKSGDKCKMKVECKFLCFLLYFIVFIKNFKKIDYKLQFWSKKGIIENKCYDNKQSKQLSGWIHSWYIEQLFKRVCSSKSLSDFHDRPLKRFLSMRATILQSAFFVTQSKTYNFLRKTVKKACFLGKFLSFW